MTATIPALADLADLTNTVKQLVSEADRILADGYGTVSATQKFDGSLVTQIDRAADDYFNAQIAARFPDHAILSEERNTVYDPSVEFTWVIDPLDGTTNFARGLPIWGVSVALLCGGLPIIGVLSFAALRENYSAILSYGAARNDRPIHTAADSKVDDQHFLMQCTRTPKYYRITSPLKSRILGSAAYHIAAVANGSALAGIETTPKLWDIAAALLILQEAGGCYRTLGQAAPVFPLEGVPRDYERKSFTLVAAANEGILSEMEASIDPLRS